MFINKTSGDILRRMIEGRPTTPPTPELPAQPADSPSMTDPRKLADLIRDTMMRQLETTRGGKAIMASVAVLDIDHYIANAANNVATIVMGMLEDE